MPFTIAMRQAPMVWKTDLICRMEHISKGDMKTSLNASTLCQCSLQISKMEVSWDHGERRGADVRMIRRHPF